MATANKMLNMYVANYFAALYKCQHYRDTSGHAYFKALHNLVMADPNGNIKELGRVMSANEIRRMIGKTSRILTSRCHEILNSTLRRNDSNVEDNIRLLLLRLELDTEFEAVAHGIQMCSGPNDDVANSINYLLSQYDSRSPLFIR